MYQYGLWTNQDRVFNFQPNPEENKPNPGFGLKKRANLPMQHLQHDATRLGEKQVLFIFRVF